jgi:hypothetical protein
MYAAQSPLIERRRATWYHGEMSPQLRLSHPELINSVFATLEEPPLPDANRALRLVIEDAVAMGFDIAPELLSFPSRGRALICLARQVSMYIAHVCLGLSFTQVGELFERDRTTAAHACEVVEQRRDEDAFDLAITRLERVIRIMCGAPGRLTGVTTPLPQHPVLRLTDSRDHIGATR